MYFVEVIYLYLKDIVMVLIKTKHNDNMTDCGKINLNMRKNDTFQPISCFCDLDLDLQYIIYEI